MPRARALTLLSMLLLPLLAFAGCGAPRTVQVPARPGEAEAPLAFVNGQRVDWVDLLAGLLEAHGGDVLAEVVLSRLVDAKLAEQGLTVGDAQIDAERDILLQSLSDQPDEARRLLAEVRRRRGIGPGRFDAMLRRNAGLRMLVRDRVEVSEQALSEAFDLLYGPKFDVRLILVDSAAEAASLVGRARAGESFVDLAVRHSNHASSARGGALGAISGTDPTVPAEVLTVVRSMQPGSVSDVVATSEGYVVVKLEQRVEGQAVTLDSVRPSLELWTRRRSERILQAKLARELVAAADVVVFDRTLNRTWRDQIDEAMIEGRRP